MSVLESEVALDVHPVAGGLGAEIRGIDLRDVDGVTWRAIERVWLDNLVVFFPDQDLDPDAHVALARRFGVPEVHPFLDKLDEEHPEIVVLTSEKGSANIWHTDVTFQQVPAKASVLRMAAAPERGGNTLFSNQYLAFESLSDAMRDFLMTLSAVHTARGYGRPDIVAEHPIVVAHPGTGRHALFVNRSFTSHIPQLRPAESDALLQLLWTWSERPEFQCRYQWEPGAVGVWDNRCTQHYAALDYSGHRRIERVTVLGDAAPVAAGTVAPHFVTDMYEQYRSNSHVVPPYRDVPESMT